jgi:hypothetical protein
MPQSKGTVTDFIQQERPERSEPTKDSPDYWRAYKTLPVEEFFKQWEENFRSLEWVVNPHDVDDGMMLRHDRETDVGLCLCLCDDMQKRRTDSFGLPVGGSTDIPRAWMV